MRTNFSEDINVSIFIKLSITLIGTALFWGATATATKAASIVFVSPSSGGVGIVNESTAKFTQVASGPTYRYCSIERGSTIRDYIQPVV